MGELYIGLMSGTSLDGVDGVLAEFDGPVLAVHAHAHRPFALALRDELLALNTPGDNELHRAALAANALAGVYAEVVEALRPAAGGRPVKAVGAHGQTVRHRPGQFDGVGYTLQLNAPALLAERCGLAVVADLRSRDLAAGGQAAPLVPAFHRECFGRPGEDVAVVNIGGIANLSLLGADGGVSGFDCGPGNALMDLWCQRHLGQPFDADGAWAARGRVDPALLQAALADPWFALPPPKSTGRDDFHADWLAALLARAPALPVPEDVQATLCELTAQAIALDLGRALPGARQLLVCGGGALNGTLMRRLAAVLPGCQVTSTAERGLPPLQVEATAFAWLARAHLLGEAGNLPAVTGARGPRVLGALYPA
jgi:anhydro-N-acetylmuramic acid kinase